MQSYNIPSRVLVLWCCPVRRRRVPVDGHTCTSPWTEASEECRNRIGIRVPGGRNYASPRRTAAPVYVTRCFARRTLSTDHRRDKLYPIGDSVTCRATYRATKGRFTLVHNRALSRPPARVCLLRPPARLPVQIKHPQHGTNGLRRNWSCA